jgi:hypothetical protein
MKVLVLLVVALALSAQAANVETFRGRLNPRGTQVAENMMRSMIRRVNDLIKQHTRLHNMRIGPVNVEGFRVRTLDTANVNIIMDRNRLGVRLNNGRVHLGAQLAVYINVLFGHIRVAGHFDTYGDGINAQLDTGLSVSGGRFRGQGMGCHLHVGRPRVDLHNPIINHFANMILNGLMPHVTNAVCNGVKKYGDGMVNSVFQAIPTNLNVLNLFRLEFPVRNFRSWSRHMVAGVGMEVRPVNNQGVNFNGIRHLPLPEAEDSHHACASVSDFVANTASRTFLPVGKSFSVDVGSILKLFFGSIFNEKVFVQGTLTKSPEFLAEPQEFRFSVAASGRILDKDGNVVNGTETEPVEVVVRAPNNEDPMFSNVKVEVKGPINVNLNLDLSKLIDMLLSFIDIAFKGKGQVALQKRARNADIVRVINEMFLGRLFSGVRLALSTRHGAVIVCLSGNPTPTATNIVYSALRRSFG